MKIMHIVQKQTDKETLNAKYRRTWKKTTFDIERHRAANDRNCVDSASVESIV